VQFVDYCSDVLIQQRDTSGYFSRSWAEFKVGFGNPSGHYWIGNERLSQTTLTGRYKLKFDLQQRGTGRWYYAEYSMFRVQLEADNYRLEVAGYHGSADHDAFGRLNGQHNGQMFTTYDRDNDRKCGNCATSYGGGFWYNNCFQCGLNVASNNFAWTGLPGDHRLQKSRMWLQCK